MRFPIKIVIGGESSCGGWEVKWWGGEVKKENRKKADRRHETKESMLQNVYCICFVYSMLRQLLD